MLWAILCNYFMGNYYSIMANLNKLIIDCNHSMTDLCKIGIKHNIDKCVYNDNPPPVGHRHPYTMVYDLLFGGMRYLPINIGEIGIFENGSIKAWRDYFVNATIYGWDFDSNYLNKALLEQVDRANYQFMNVHDVNCVDRNLKRFNGLYDIIVDDSDHYPDWAMNIMSVAYKHLRTGGVFVIEDVGIDEHCTVEQYAEGIENNPAKKYYNGITLIECKHDLMRSCNNDRMIVMYRNDVQ